MDYEELTLPPNWAKRYDVDADKWYFIDHVNKITTWVDPRAAYYSGLTNPRTSVTSDAQKHTHRRSVTDKHPSELTTSSESSRCSTESDIRRKVSSPSNSRLHNNSARLTDLYESRSGKTSHTETVSNDALGALRNTGQRRHETSMDKALERAATTNNRSGYAQPNRRKLSDSLDVSVSEKSSTARGSVDLSRDSTALNTSQSHSKRAKPRSNSEMIPSGSSKTGSSGNRTSSAKPKDTRIGEDQKFASAMTKTTDWMTPAMNTTSKLPTRGGASSNRVVPRGPDPNIRVKRVQSQGPDRNLQRGPDPKNVRGPQPRGTGLIRMEILVP